MLNQRNFNVLLQLCYTLFIVEYLCLEQKLTFLEAFSQHLFIRKSVVYLL